MNFTVSKAKLEEISEIDSMLTNLIQDEREKYNNNINENYKVKEFYEKFIDNEDKIIFVARENDMILGYVYGFIQDNGSFYNSKVAQLDALFVKEQYRGNGVARSLIIPNPKEEFTAQEIDGYKVEELKRILEFKKKRNAPKDKPYIEKIAKYLE